MYTFDASSMIHAWDNYPLENFPPFWDWFEEQIESSNFSIPEVAYEEVKHKLPECIDWLSERDIEKLALTDEELRVSLQIQSLLGISGGDFHPKGVDENDILIIASAKTAGLHLVTNEARQFSPPKDKKRYKIPTVCSLPQVDVEHIQLIELIRDSGKVFR